MRIKIISLSTDDMKLSLTELDSALEKKNIEKFLESVENSTRASGLRLKQNDKKKDRLVIHANRKSLIEQVVKYNKFFTSISIILIVYTFII